MSRYVGFLITPNIVFLEINYDLSKVILRQFSHQPFKCDESSTNPGNNYNCIKLTVTKGLIMRETTFARLCQQAAKLKQRNILSPNIV